MWRGSWKEAQGHREEKDDRCPYFPNCLGEDVAVRGNMKTGIDPKNVRRSFCLLFLGQQRTYISPLSTLGPA